MQIGVENQPSSSVLSLRRELFSAYLIKVYHFFAGLSIKMLIFSAKGTAFVVIAYCI